MRMYLQRTSSKSISGRVLYTDNYYSSEVLIDMLYKKYKMFLVSTISLTKKKSRTEDDFAFHKLNGPAKKKVEKRWMK